MTQRDLPHDGDDGARVLARDSRAITRVALKNFKSIASCDVELSPLTLIVGPNGSGKSNFVDALTLTRDALNTNLENAIRERGGVDAVRRRSAGHPAHFAVRLDIALPDGRAEYAFQIAARPEFMFSVQRERCRVVRNGAEVGRYEAKDGLVESHDLELGHLQVAKEALALPVVGSLPHFAPVLETLADMGFYNFNPDRVRQLQNPDVGDTLASDGRNIASVIRRLRSSSPRTVDRIVDYLAAVVPGIKGVGDLKLGPMETLEFRQDVAGDAGPWKFLASNVSDGTLRALCVLVAAFQESPSLVGIEEPEVAVHPGAAQRVMDALLEASRRRQMVLTTHSPDLLDHDGVDIDAVIAVESQRGETRLGPVDAATRSAVRDNLYTVGELLRLEQMTPDLFASTDVRLF